MPVRVLLGVLLVLCLWILVWLGVKTGVSAPYAAAKAGVIMLSRHLAREIGPHGIRVNCLTPSAIDFAGGRVMV